jgi:hypothetical protein
MLDWDYTARPDEPGWYATLTEGHAGADYGTAGNGRMARTMPAPTFASLTRRAPCMGRRQGARAMNSLPAVGLIMVMAGRGERDAERLRDGFVGSGWRDKAHKDSRDGPHMPLDL